MRKFNAMILFFFILACWWNWFTYVFIWMFISFYLLSFARIISQRVHDTNLIQSIKWGNSNVWGGFFGWNSGTRRRRRSRFAISRDMCVENFIKNYHFGRKVIKFSWHRLHLHRLLRKIKCSLYCSKSVKFWVSRREKKENILNDKKLITQMFKKSSEVAK